MRTVSDFKGLNQGLVISDTEFSAMRNMSDLYYPAIATRPARGTVQSIANANGLYYKNHLFYVSGTKCYYNGNEVSGLTVTSGRKQIVGMGAYIIIFPDKKIFNTAAGEVTSIDDTFAAGIVRFDELSTDSVFTKIRANNIHTHFRQYDGVKISGVNDDSFKLDGGPVTKVVTEVGENYIVVTASIQSTFSGDLTLEASGTSTKISGTGIGEKFKVNDRVNVTGLLDSGITISNALVSAVSSGYITVDVAFPAKDHTQTSTMQFEPYFSGSDKTKISYGGMGEKFDEGDVITISGCNNSGYNTSFVIRGAGNGYILVDKTLGTAFSQASGITITRTKVKQSATVKRVGFAQTSGITFSRESPAMDFVCEHDNRLWGCSSLNHEIYASKLGDPTNWNCYEGISTDSYAVTVGSDGDFTGCISHMGYVLFFKENAIHMMYGSKPSNYQLNSKQLPGVRAGCSDSLCIVNETLYYVGRNGVYAFDGAIPTKISEGIKDEISNARSSQQDGKMYVSCLLNGTQTMLCYDPRYRIWDIEDGTKFDFSVYGDGVLYFIEGNTLKTITGSDTGIIQWMIESGDLVESSLLNKYISKAMFNFWMEAGAEADIYFRYDDDPLWHRKGTVHSIVNRTFTIPIISERCSKFRWKIEGRGNAKLLGMAVTVEGGSEINVGIESPYRR